MNATQKPSLRHRARAVFVDLEHTLILPHPGQGGAGLEQKMLEAIVQIFVDKHGASVEEARRRVRDAFGEVWLSIENTAAELDLDAREVREALKNQLSAIYYGDEHAKSALEHFHRIGLKLWPATTNSGAYCHLKLDAVELSGNGTDVYFEEFCGGSEVHPLGKITREFFQNLMKRANVPADEVVHIGDNQIWDRDIPMSAGIRKVILLDRNLPERYLQGEKGEIYARSWSVIRHLVVPMDSK